MSQKSELYTAVRKMVEVKADRYFTRSRLITEGVLWAMDENLFLIIKPNQDLIQYYTLDATIGPETTVTEDDINIALLAITVFTEEAIDRNKIPLTTKLWEPIENLIRILRNKWGKGIKRYNGQYLTDVNRVLSTSFDYYARKIIALGNEKARLVNSRVIEDRLFLYTSDGSYTVIWPDAPVGKTSIYHATELNLDSCQERWGIAASMEKTLVASMKSWLVEQI